MKHVSVYGLGLLGGSLCRALKAVDPAIRISAYNTSRASLVKAKDAGVIDSILESCHMPKEGADLAVVAVPVKRSIGVISALLDECNPGEIVIDLGSVKDGIVKGVLSHRNLSRFVPCHPMAGSERSGFDASNEALYKGASVVITPHEKNSESDIEKISELWQMLGSHVTVAQPEVHDKIVSYTSHLPHVASCALASVVHSLSSGKDEKEFAGRGLFDMTRLAAGSVDMWTDISMMNSDNLVNAINSYIAELSAVREMISNKDEAAVKEYMERSSRSRKEIVNE